MQYKQTNLLGRGINALSSGENLDQRIYGILLTARGRQQQNRMLTSQLRSSFLQSQNQSFYKNLTHRSTMETNYQRTGTGTLRSDQQVRQSLSPKKLNSEPSTRLQYSGISKNESFVKQSHDRKLSLVGKNAEEMMLMRRSQQGPIFNKDRSLQIPQTVHPTEESSRGSQPN